MPTSGMANLVSFHLFVSLSAQIFLSSDVSCCADCGGVS